MVIFNIHGKATGMDSGQEDYQRRKVDAETFYAYLNDFYSDSALVVTGDYNDIFLGTVVSETDPSPYQIFLDDDERWNSPSLPLEERGLASFIGFNRGFLDHFLITNELVPILHRTYLEGPQAYLSSYSTTVSDHLPVTTRLFLDGTTDVNEEGIVKGASVRIAPNPMMDHGMAEIVLNVPSNVRVRLVDNTGQAHTLLNEYLQPQIRLVQIPVQELASGAYQLQVIVGNEMTTLPVVITR